MSKIVEIDFLLDFEEEGSSVHGIKQIEKKKNT